MPQVIGALVVSAELAADIGASIGVSAGAVQSAAGTIIITAASMGLQYALAPKPPVGANHIAMRQTTAPRNWGYGRGRIGGVYALYDVATGISTDVIAHCQGPICGFAEYYLNDKKDNLISGAGGKLTVMTRQDGAYQNGHVYLYNRLGLPTETAYAAVTEGFATTWDSTHRGDGVASTALFAVSVSQEKTPQTYPQGHPELSVTIDFPAIWDPRDPAQDPDDPETWVDYPVFDVEDTYAEGDRILYNACPYISTINGNVGNIPGGLVVESSHYTDSTDGQVLNAWIRVSSNPVLQLIDLTNPDHGMGLARDVIITPVLAALMVEADLCDELVLRKDGNYEPRYASNGWFNYETAPADVINSILATCDGWATEGGDGTLALQVGVYRAPTVTFTDRHRLSGFSVAYGIANEQKVNELTLKFTSPKHRFKEIEGAALRDEPDIALRGKARSQALALPWVQSHAQARRLQKRARARLNPISHGTFTTTLYGLAALGQRYVRVQFSFFAGLTDAVVEIQGAEVDLVAGKITWEWIKVDPTTIDAWDPETEEGREPPQPGDVSGETLPVPANVHAIAGGDPPFHIDVSWDKPPGYGTISVYLTFRVRYRLTGGSWSYQNFDEPLVVGDHLVVSIFPTTNDDYEIQVASKGSRGSISEWSSSAFLSTTYPALDFSKAKNSIYFLMGYV